jgi:hypothetical protein
MSKTQGLSEKQPIVGFWRKNSSSKKWSWGKVMFRLSKREQKFLRLFILESLAMSMTKQYLTFTFSSLSIAVLTYGTGIFSIIAIICYTLCFPAKSSISCVSWIPPVVLPPIEWCPVDHATPQNRNIEVSRTFMNMQISAQRGKKTWTMRRKQWICEKTKEFRILARTDFSQVLLAYQRWALAWKLKGFSGIPTVTNFPFVFSSLKYGSKEWAYATVSRMQSIDLAAACAVSAHNFF